MVDISDNLDPDLQLTIEDKLGFYSRKLYAFGIIIGFLSLVTLISLIIIAFSRVAFVDYIFGLFVLTHLVVLFYLLDFTIYLYRIAHKQFRRQKLSFEDGRYVMRDGKYQQISGVERDNATALFYLFSSFLFSYLWWAITGFVWNSYVRNILPQSIASSFNEASGFGTAVSILSAFTGIQFSTLSTQFGIADIVLLGRILPALFVLFIGFRYFVFLTEKLVELANDDRSTINSVGNEWFGFTEIILRVIVEFSTGGLRRKGLHFILSLCVAACGFALFLGLTSLMFL